jgi:hypothetical protein
LGMVPTRYIGHILSSISINFSFFGFVEVVFMTLPPEPLKSSPL